MDKIVQALAWPGFMALVAVAAMIIFRAPLTTLIQRTRSVGKIGLETYQAQPSQPADEAKAIDEFFRALDNPLTLLAEEFIRKELKQLKLETPPDREKALIRFLALARVSLTFERVASFIWASQMTLLRSLNLRADGAAMSEVTVFYELGKKQAPTRYENYPAERWLGFLQAFDLISMQDSRIFITVAGREFLKYQVALGRPEPSYG